MIPENHTETITIQPPPATILIIPGLGGSGKSHWQSLWHKEYANSIQLRQDNWDEPQLDQWLHRLNTAMLPLAEPVVLVAHSLGVALAAHWAGRYGAGPVRGALLVAPADVDSPSHTPAVVRSFAPVPVVALPFPSVVVASEDDPYVSIERAAFFAGQWSSRFVNVGAKGHINADSALGDWQEGKRLLDELMRDVLRDKE